VPAAESDQWLVFEVTDTGCGISQRGLASLFTEYVQVSVVCKLSMVQWCSPSCCVQRTASSLMPAFALFCSIACALLLCQQLSATHWPFSIGISTVLLCQRLSATIWFSSIGISTGQLASSLVMQIACLTLGSQACTAICSHAPLQRQHLHICKAAGRYCCPALQHECFSADSTVPVLCPS